MKLVCLVLVPLFLTRKLLPGAWLLVLVLILPSLPFLSGLVEWANGVRHFAGSGAFNAPLHTLLASTGLSLDIVRGIGTLAFGLSALTICVARWRGMLLIDSCICMLGSLLVCSPIVHFWYLCWILPLVALRPSFAWTTLSISMGGYFMAWWTLANSGWWGFGHQIAAIIWLPWLFAGIAQHRSIVSKLRVGRLVPEIFKTCVVVPALNVSPELKSLIATLRSDLDAGDEIVIVDSGSTVEREIDSARIISAKRGRGNQIAAGIVATTAPWILIVHDDSVPCSDWLVKLEQATRTHPDAVMFVFGQRFDRTGPGTLLLEALNEIRVVFGGVAFGDQTMAIRRSAMNLAGGFPAQPLMEDVEASLRLAGTGRVVYLGLEWRLSARKWSKRYAHRFLLVIRLVAGYQLARLKGPAHASKVAEKMYREYYPEVASNQVNVQPPEI